MLSTGPPFLSSLTFSLSSFRPLLLPSNTLRPFLPLALLLLGLPLSVVRPSGLAVPPRLPSRPAVGAMNTAETLVSQANLFENALRRLVSGILVRVVLLRQTPVRLPDLQPRRFRLYAQDFVWIDFVLCHQV